MKKIKKFAALLAAAAVLMLLPDANAVTAEAAEPVTYAVKYISAEGIWRYQPNTNAYDDTVGGGYISTLLQEIKDGDVVVIYNDTETRAALDLGSVKLSNLTYFMNAQTPIVYAGGVTDCYVLGGTIGTINCDVKNAYVYDTVTFNFNGNVENLTLYAEDAVKSSLGVAGTVGHLYAPSTTSSHIHFDYYDFEAGALLFTNGSFTPNGSYHTPEEHMQLSASTGTVPAASAASDDEYDDVPQTGQERLYLWLLCASAVCFAGSCAMRRSAR